MYYINFKNYHTLTFDTCKNKSVTFSCEIKRILTIQI